MSLLVRRKPARHILSSRVAIKPRAVLLGSHWSQTCTPRGIMHTGCSLFHLIYPWTHNILSFTFTNLFLNHIHLLKMSMFHFPACVTWTWLFFFFSFFPVAVITPLELFSTPRKMVAYLLLHSGHMCSSFSHFHVMVLFFSLSLSLDVRLFDSFRRLAHAGITQLVIMDFHVQSSQMTLGRNSSTNCEHSMYEDRGE